MRFSIITPSFNQPGWLRLCVASVADQEVDLEHIVQDSCSDEKTQEWLPHDKRVKAFIEKDSGMYDAVNRGLRRASGEILSYLNCDEQYLAGALKAVSNYFDQHPEIGVVFANALIVDTKGDLICTRRVQLPWYHHVMVSYLNTFTCATFFRKRILDQGFFFDPGWRASGDAEWVCRMLKAKVRMGLLPVFTSAFADTGSNLALGANALREKAQMFKSAPLLAQKLSFVLVGLHRLRRLFSGAYSRKPLDFAVYTMESPSVRVLRHVAKPTFLWKSRLG